MSKNGFVITAEAEQLNMCCGIIELGDFAKASDKSDNYWYDGPVNDTLRQQIRDNQRHVQILGTVRSTPKEVYKILKAHSFMKLARYRNPNSGNIIQVWVRKPTKPRRKRR